MKTNVLYYGDNLDILRNHIPDESVDLIYLDPPFNSQATYNVLFREVTGAASEAQIEAFEDTWHWGPTAAGAYEEVVMQSNQDVARLLKAIVEGLSHNDVTAYLTMMAIRLLELRRVLKPSGSVYLHCDPTAGPYLRVLMDAVFGARNFRNEIVWKRTSAHSSAKRYGPVHDVLLFYSRTDDFTWNQSFQPYDQYYLDQFYTHTDASGRRWRRSDLTGAGVRHGETGLAWRGIDVTAKGRHWASPPTVLEQMDADGKIHWPAKQGGMPMLKRYADMQPGVPLQDVWTGIRPIHNLGRERLGYPTQKPLALLERIINASSNPGDVVLDPFCGCGTAVHAAHKLGRPWIGIDITHLAIGLMRRRMRDAFPGLSIDVEGEPKDLAGAQFQAATNPKQFEYWVVDKLDAVPTGGKGPDLDGVKPFMEFGGKAKRAVISVKGTKVVNPEMVREVKGALAEDKPIGALAMLAKPTKGMITQAAKAGFYDSAGSKYPRLQLLTVEEMLAGKRLALPSPASAFTKAPVEKEKGGQESFL